MEKGENQASWRATVVEAMTVFRFKTQCETPESTLGSIQLSFSHWVLQVKLSDIIQ